MELVLDRGSGVVVEGREIVEEGPVHDCGGFGYESGLMLVFRFDRV